MKIKLHSHYNHFPEHIPEEGERYVECFNDAFVKKDVPENSIALLIEPRPLQPRVYEYIEQNYKKFVYVFTHDSTLLRTLPNAKKIIWGGVWGWGDEEKDFTHPISMVASWKEEAPARIQRKHLAMELKDKIDCYGTFNGGEFATTKEIYGKYPFSVVIENHIDDYWITEKICNCFSHNTVPIYMGAYKITELFDPRGIIIARSIDDIRRIVDKLLANAKEEYDTRLSGIRTNREIVEKYENFEKWFYNEYGGMLDEIVNNNTVL